MRPFLEYGSSIWAPPGVVLQEELESVEKKRAARFVTGNYIYNYETGNMTGIFGTVKMGIPHPQEKEQRQQIHTAI